MALGKTRGC